MSNIENIEIIKEILGSQHKFWPSDVAALTAALELMQKEDRMIEAVEAQPVVEVTEEKLVNGTHTSTVKLNPYQLKEKILTKLRSIAGE